MSNTNDGRFLHMGPVAVTYASGVIDYVYGIEVRPSGNVVRAPDIESCSAPMDVRVSNRGLTIYVKDASVRATTLAAALGIASSHIASSAGGGSTLSPDSTDTSVDIGACALSFSRDDGTFCRYYLKRAAKVPMLEAIKHGKSAFAEFAYAFECLEPADGSHVPYIFEEGMI